MTAYYFLCYTPAQANFRDIFSGLAVYPIFMLVSFSAVASDRQSVKKRNWTVVSGVFWISEFWAVEKLSKIRFLFENFRLSGLKTCFERIWGQNWYFEHPLFPLWKIWSCLSALSKICRKCVVFAGKLQLPGCLFKTPLAYINVRKPRIFPIIGQSFWQRTFGD